jgi:hypothetical protein
MAKVDWTAVEKLLVNTATKQLATFAKAHAGEVFYGAIFDVETYDGASVSLLLNTEAHLLKEWGETVGKKELHRRFLPGAFLHRLPLTKTKAFPGDAIEALVEQDIDDDTTDADGLWATAGTFLGVVCSAAHTLEQGALAQLTRTSDFAISVTPDPSEPGDFAIKRYAKFKKRLAKTNAKKPPSKPTGGH